MKTRLAKLISLFLAVLLCLMSCTSDGGVTEGTDTPDSAVSPIQEDGSIDYGAINLSAFSDTVSDAEKIELTHSYAFQQLPEPEDGWGYNRQHIETHDGTLYIDMLKLDERKVVVEQCLAALDFTDGIVKSVPYTKPKVFHYDKEELIESTGGFFMLDENLFLHTTYTTVLGYPPNRDELLQSGYLMLCDAAGNVQAEHIIPGIGTNKYIAVLPDGRIAVLGDESVCIYDAELHLRGQIEGSTKTSLFTTPKGELLADGLYLGTYLRIDADQYTSASETYYDNPENIKGITRMYFSAAESTYEVYYANDTGFWGYHVGDAEAVLLCSWSNSGQIFDNLTILGVQDADHILVSVRDPFTNTSTVGWLYRNPDAQTQKKIPIRLGLIDSIFQYYSGTHKTTLKNAVNHFNAHNSDYFVEIVDYSSTRDDFGEISDAFTEAMLSGTGADILVSSKYLRNALRIYTTKNAFVDLQEAFGDVLLPCIHSAYDESSGALYSIPINMYLNLPVSLETTLSSDRDLTLEVLYDLAEHADESVTDLFNCSCSDGKSVLSDKIFASAVPSFYDEETGECAFESAAFGKLLTFLETVRDRTAGNGMALTCFYGDYSMESDALPKALQSGGITFLEFPFHRIDALAILKQLYGDTAFALHGYPSQENEFVSFRSDLDLHLNAASKVKLGAAQFLAYLLSDTIQLYSANTTLPVTVSAVESLLSAPTFVYTPDTMHRLDLTYDAKTLELVFPEAIRITYNADDLAMIRHLLYETETVSEPDATVQSIIKEELSAYQAGVRSLEEAQSIIQSRLWIYINE